MSDDEIVVLCRTTNKQTHTQMHVHTNPVTFTVKYDKNKFGANALDWQLGFTFFVCVY